MKKILFLTGVAMCAFTLATSCVKDSESPSVTEIRNAKTEQLKAAAELAKAQAAAQALTAQANANLANAQAELQKAQAEVQNAQAEALKLQNALAEAKMEAEKAEIAVRIANAKASEARAQQDLQSVLNQIEKDKLTFEYQMNKLKAALEMQAADDAVNELQAAADNYKWAVNDLINAQSDLNSMNVNLARFEVYQKDWESVKENAIKELKHSIAQEQSRIEVYKQYANYTEDVEALRDKRDAVYDKYFKLSDDYNFAWNASNAVSQQKAINEAFAKLEENTFWQVFVDWSDITLSDGETVVPFSDTKASWINRNTDWEFIEKVVATYTSKDGFEYEFRPYSFTKRSPATIVNIEGIWSQISDVNPDLINMKVKEDKAAYAKDKKDLEDALKTLNDELKPLKETEAAKLAALNAIEVGAEGYEAAKVAYVDAVAAVNAKQSEIDSKTEDLDNLSKESEAYDIIADFVVKYTENCEVVDALYDNVLEGISSDYAEQAKAFLAYHKTGEERDETWTEFSAITMVLYDHYSGILGANSIANRIESCENDIKNYQAQIDNYDLDNTSFEQQIETIKKNIALQEEYIKSLEVIANQRKAEYEAVLAKYQN